MVAHSVGPAAYGAPAGRGGRVNARARAGEAEPPKRPRRPPPTGRASTPDGTTHLPEPTPTWEVRTDLGRRGPRPSGTTATLPRGPPHAGVSATDPDGTRASPRTRSAEQDARRATSAGYRCQRRRRGWVTGPSTGGRQVQPIGAHAGQGTSTSMIGMKNFSVRTARWSARHPWRAIVGWFLFVALCLGAGLAVGGNPATSEDYRVGEAGRAEAMAAEGGLQQRPLERVLITAPPVPDRWTKPPPTRPPGTSPSV